MPTGRTLREDGESHLDAWMRISRWDPCAYCGSAPAMTADHIVPKASGLPGVYRWDNITGACSSCNGGKNARALLRFLWLRHRAPVFRPGRRVASRQIPDQEAA